jgi:heme-degrading monooxygenase HmoA
MIVVMVRIPVGSPEEGKRIEERFRNRAGLVEKQPGFLGFELLRGEGEYISMTRWASREALDAWMKSEAHAQAHTRATVPTRGGHPTGAGHRPPPPESSVMVYEVVIGGNG